MLLQKVIAIWRENNVINDVIDDAVCLALSQVKLSAITEWLCKNENISLAN